MPGAVANIRTWGETVRLSHSVFALPFAVLATFLAARPRLPSWTQLGLIVVCMVAARSAAMTFNRIVDARFDAANPRTTDRPLPTGKITPTAAWLFFAGACVLFIAGCAGFWQLWGNGWPLILSLPVIALLCCYSYTKRFTQLSHVVLGAVIALAPVGAWIAINPASLGAPAWLLMLAVMFWIAGFDLIYACQDVDFDRRTGLYSLPAQLGIAAALWTARAFHVITVAALVAVGVSANLGALYFTGVGCVAVLLVVENALVHPDDLSRVNLAFFTVNGIVGVVLGGLGVLDIWLEVANTS
ncbi:MAG: putative 4-hydroxybenzoate polyprenyltransferase [Planctomycetes bacterium]|nr:putative 4-hydroxybenzoate polyprenyltransferase [Planctomycetota bacterium]